MREHVCRYRQEVVWTSWKSSGALTERQARRIPLCEVCGKERPGPSGPPVLREVRAKVADPRPAADATGRKIAKALLRLGKGREGLLPTRNFLTDLSRKGIPANLTEEWIEKFLRVGWLTVVWTPGNPPGLTAVALRKPKALRDFARPGDDNPRQSILVETKARVEPLSHPKAAEISALLKAPEAENLPPRMLQSLGALAVHVEAGEVLTERAFATRHLGDSGALASVRKRLEKLLGPLAGIGVREGASVFFLGGEGVLRLADREIDLRILAPFLGLARDVLGSLTRIKFPAGGLFVVENLAAFEACCRGEVEAARDALIAWSEGYPDRCIRRLVELAGATGAPVRIWADLDLDGVWIARLTASWSCSDTDFFRMSPRDVESAPAHRELTETSLAAIRRDLEEHPEAPLADTLRALLASGSWVEQEAFLSGK